MDFGRGPPSSAGIGRPRIVSSLGGTAGPAVSSKSAILCALPRRTNSSCAVEQYRAREIRWRRESGLPQCLQPLVSTAGDKRF